VAEGIRLSIGPSEDRILRSLARYHYLSAPQVCKLFYSPGSLTYVQTKLNTLATQGYLLRLFLPRPARYGRPLSVFTLARKGINYLSDVGVTVIKRFQPSEERDRSYLHLSHTLALNEILIAAELLCNSVDTISIDQLEHEQDLKRNPLSVKDVDGSVISVIPDAWIQFIAVGEDGRRYKYPITVELDRGTIEQKAFRRKVRGLTESLKGAYIKRFGSSAITIALVTTTSQKRVDDMVKWTMAELQMMHMEPMGPSFRFTAVDISEMPPTLFLETIWTQPFVPGKTPLLEGIRLPQPLRLFR
jgi:hypothetical protein